MTEPLEQPGTPGGCQQILRVETLYWQQVPERGRAAGFTWVSDLRGRIRLCRRHAKQIGLENCQPIGAAVRGNNHVN